MIAGIGLKVSGFDTDHHAYYTYDKMNNHNCVI